MTSRVRECSPILSNVAALHPSLTEKGGTVFRPVLKPRTRLDSQQVFVAGDFPDSDTNGSTPSMPSVPMPQPSIVGDTLSNDPDIPNFAVEAPTPSPPTNQPPSLLTENSRPITSTFRNLQLENAPHPPMIMSHAVLLSASTETSRPNIFNAPGPISSTSLSTSVPVPPISQSHVLHHSVTENIHEHITGAEAVIEARSSSQRTMGSVGPNSHQEALDQAIRALAETNSIMDRDISTSEPPTKRRKKRKAEAENAVTRSQPLELQNDRRRRGSSGTPHPRKSRGPSLPPFDPHADPGEDLDPTVVTMASLCNDTGQGRISSKAAEVLSNHVTWKSQNRAKRARMKTLMELKKYGREEDTEGGEENQNLSLSKDLRSLNVATARPGGPLVSNDTEDGFDYSQDLQTSRYNVQVRIGPNGETIIDEESLVVDRTEVEDTTSYTHVVESDHTKFVNSGTYGRRYRGSRWSAEETELFYDASYHVPFEGVLSFHTFYRPSHSMVKTTN